MYGTIYKILNKVTGQIYIGQTIRPLQYRFAQHKYAANYSSSKYSYLHRSIKKYGAEAFIITPVLRAESQEELNSREEFCIRLFDSLAPKNLNLKTKHAGHGSLSPETRMKLRNAHLGKKRGPHKPETIEKIRNSNRGKKRDLETKEKLRLSHLGKANVAREKSIKVFKFGEFHKNYSSITLAAKELGVHRNSITNVLTGHSKTFNKKQMTAVYSE